MDTQPKRLLSLDVFRGLTIAGMILVNSPGNDSAYGPLEHAKWNGMTPTDLVFPFFVFIVGVSLVFSLRSRLEQGVSRTELLGQVFKRSLIIFGLGLLLNGFPLYNLSTIRILGVLQRIGLCYFFASVIFLWGTLSTQILALVAILLGYWGFMTLFPVPGYGADILTMEGNLASFIDRALLARHLYRPIYDPEGILSTFPAVATALCGTLTGMWLRFSSAQVRKVTGMLQAGLVCLLAGWKWGYFFPINKALWTSSYVLVTAGWALVLFSLCYWLIEIRGWRRWSKPLEVFGVNALAAYVLHVFFLKVQNRISMPRLDGSAGNLRFFITDHLFGTWLNPMNASLAYAVGYVLLWLLLFWNFYRRKVFIKI